MIGPSTQERLLRRLRDELGLDLPEGTTLVRTYRNRQTGIGTWSWFATCPSKSILDIGSHWPMRDLLAAPALAATRMRGSGDTCIDQALDTSQARS